VKSTVRWSLAAATGVLLAGAVVLFTAPEARARSKEGTAAAPLPRVQLATTHAVTASAREQVTGTLEPSKRVQLGFEVTGRLARPGPAGPC
jgi:multidrug efflux pump subunit AcrA (membrane-fusion protein)